MRSMIRRSWWSLLVGLLSIPLARAQEPRALLMIHDTPLTEQLGEAVYGGSLGAIGYAELQVLHGSRDRDPRARSLTLALAIEDLARRATGPIDVFLAVHDGSLDPQMVATRAARARGRVRLLYTTACNSARTRGQWAGLAPRALVTHEGINVPLVAMPLVLSRWGGGAPLGAALDEGYQETLRCVYWVFSLPGTERVRYSYDPSGSRPVVTGDADLRAGGARVERPDLVYDRARGGPVGLALRAAAGRFQLDRADLASITLTLSRLQLPPDVLPAEAMAQVQSLSIERDERGEGVLTLRSAGNVRVSPPGLPADTALILNPLAQLRVGRFDPERRQVELRLRGVVIDHKGLHLRVRHLELRDDPQRGYEVEARVDALGIIPVTRAFPLFGGRAPQPVGPADVARRDPSSGLAGALGQASATGSVTAEALHLRAGPGLGHAVVATLPRGERLEVLAERGSWLEVEASGQRGWVAARYVGR